MRATLHNNWKLNHKKNSHEIIIAGRNQQLLKQSEENQAYFNKVKQIKALRKFEEIFRKEQLLKIEKNINVSEEEIITRHNSPHQLRNRLKGMFFLKQKIDIKDKYKFKSDLENEDEKIQEPLPVEGKTFSSPKKLKISPRKTKILNFINKSNNFSSTNMSKAAMHQRPSTRIESSFSAYHTFNNHSLSSIVLAVNKVRVISCKANTFTYFSVFVEDGNNSEMIKSAVRKRSGWRVVETPHVANMIWSQYYRANFDIIVKKIRRDIEIQKEEEAQSKNKKSELPNLETNRVQRNEGIFSQHKSNENQLFTLEEYNKQVARICPFGEDMNRVAITNLHMGPSLYFYNHIPNNHCISDKKHLLANLRRLFELKGLNVFEVVPFSVQLSCGCSEEEIASKIINKNPDGYWIVKPGQNSNRGRGISVCKGLPSIIKEINHKFSSTSPAPNTNTSPITADGQFQVPSKTPMSKLKKARQQESLILQQYLEPLLYCKRKFDIRMYLLVTIVNNKMRGYLYDEGYLRTSCKIFSLDSFSKYIHLTNDAIQCKSSDYGKYEEGNKVSWKKFQSWLIEEGHPHYFPSFQEQTKKISQNILKSVKSLFTKKHWKHWSDHQIIMRKCHQEEHEEHEKNQQFMSLDVDQLSEKNKIYYEIFGLDFMIDKNMKIWLIEANTNPAITTDCSRVVNNLIPRMIDNALAIAVEPFVKSKYSFSSKLQNHFDAIYDDQWAH